VVAFVSSSLYPCKIALVAAKIWEGLLCFLPKRVSFLAFQRHHKKVYKLVMLAWGCLEESIPSIISGTD
jgi:hypothetical protein